MAYAHGCRKCLVRLYFVCDWPVNFHPSSWHKSGIGKVWRCPKCGWKAVYASDSVGGYILIHQESREQ